MSPCSSASTISSQGMCSNSYSCSQSGEWYAFLVVDILWEFLEKLSFLLALFKSFSSSKLSHHFLPPSIPALCTTSELSSQICSPRGLLSGRSPLTLYLYFAATYSDIEMDLPSLCREYVNGQTSSDAPVTLAHGELAVISNNSIYCTLFHCCIYCTCMYVGIQNGVIDLLKLVEALGWVHGWFDIVISHSASTIRIYLTSSNVDNRCSGIKLLSKVLIQLNLISHKLPIEDGQWKISCSELFAMLLMPLQWNTW